MRTKGTRFRKYIIMAVVFILTAACIVGTVIYLSMDHGSYDVYDVMDKWTVDYHGHHYENMSGRSQLPDHTRSKKNDVLTMTAKIDAKGADRLTVRVYSRLSSLRVSVIDRHGDDREVYFYGYSDVNGLDTGDFLGSGYHFAELPQGSYGKTLKIMEMGSYDGALKGIPEVVVTSFNDAMPAFVHERVIAAFITIFMLLMGIWIILLSLFVSIFDKDFFKLTFLGLFSVSGALWCMCVSKVIEIFSRDIQLNGIMEYMSLYVLLIPLLALALTFFNNIPTWQRIVMFGSLCLDLGLAIAAYVLQLTHLANIDFLLPYFHAIMLADAFLLIIVSAMHWRESRLAEKFFEIGIFAAAISSLLYMAIYYVSSLAHMDSGFLNLVLIPVAFLFMSILILIGYISDLYEKRSEDVQRHRLYATSGIDSLTGLRNNIIGESVLRRLQIDGEDYMLINFDLNGLGAVNRQHGNKTGDQIIRCFADILRDVFPDSDLISRMGGDEFYVIYEKYIITVQELDSRFADLAAREKEVSSGLALPVVITASYGYALSTEVRDRDAKLVYQLANQRMYQMKLNAKNRRADV